MGDGFGAGVGLATGVGAGVGSGVGTGVGWGAGAEDWRAEMTTFVGGCVKFPGEALKPKETLPPTGMAEFQETGRNSDRVPERLWEASHGPEGVVARSIATTQLVIGAEVVLMSFTEAVSPLPQSETTRNSMRSPFCVTSEFGEPAKGAGVGVGSLGATGVGAGVGAGAGEAACPPGVTEI